MPTEQSSKSSDRLAPGALALVQDFLNAPDTEPTPEELRVAAAIRREAVAGESQAAIAARHGVSQQLISAILRGKRGATTGSGPHVAAPTLGTPSSTRAWLSSRGFEVTELTRVVHGRLLRLRAGLLALCFANNGEGGFDALHELNELAADVPLRVSFEPHRGLAPAGGGVLAFEATILAAVYDSMGDGRWRRLKACPADRCRYVFYDTSRNRNSTWCSMAICGNRTKVRTYQQRVREARRPGTAQRA